MNLFNDASLIITPNATKASKLYAIKPTDGSGDLTVTRATTATRVNSAGLIESVAVNVPRLDYLNASCPSILVEPQRTNISNYVESGTGSFNAATVVSAPNILGLTAFKVTSNSGTYADFPSLNVNSEYQANTQYTLSFYTDFSKCTGTEVSANLLGIFSGLAYVGIEVNKSTKTITTFNIGGVWTLNNYSVKQINGEIYRIIITATPNATAVTYSRNYISTANTFDFEVAGVQLEVGSYATSFIKKSSGISVTRNADLISKTGISSLIGQTEGTIFVDFKLNGNSYSDNTLLYYITLAKNSPFNFFEILRYNNSLLYYIAVNGVGVGPRVLTAFSNLNGNYKFAVSYNSSGLKCFLNGTQIYTSSDVIPTCDEINFGDYDATVNQKNNFNSIQLYKTALSDTEMATLTTL